MFQPLLRSKTTKKPEAKNSNNKIAEDQNVGNFALKNAQQIVALQQFERATETPKTFPDFNRIQNLTGRWYRMSDAVCVAAAFVLGGLMARVAGYWLQGSFQQIISLATLQQFAIFASVCFAAIMWFDTKGHYRQRLPHWETVGHVFNVTFIGLVCGGFIQFAIKEPSSRLWVGLSWMLFGALVLVGRSMSHRILSRRGLWNIPALVIGEGATAEHVVRALQKEKKMGYTILRLIPSASMDKLIKTSEWKSLLRKHDASHVFIALEGGETERHGAALKALARAWVPFSIVPPWFGLPSSTLSSHHFMMQDVFLLHDTNRLQLPLPCFVKRSFDIVVSSLVLLMLALPLSVIALMVRRDGGPAFFTQKRVGRNGKLFNCYKFRSMRSDAEAVLGEYLANNPEAAEEWKKYQKLKQDVRITSFGNFIRRTSIDEFPQFLNVLKGDMSIVGPRPIMSGQECLYNEDFCFYESVRPGITGPWQVSGRNKLTFKQRVELESWYARNWSLWVDIVIMLKTLPALLKKDQVF